LRYISIPLAIVLCAPLFAREDFAGLALKIAKDELKEEGWKKFVKNAEADAKQFANDNMGADRSRMLNELIESLARGLDGVDLKKTKRFVYWMAMFSEWNECLPDSVLEELCKHEKEYAELRDSFSWDKLQAIIKAGIEAEAKKPKPKKDNKG
jgi:hypothetical protein